MDKKGEKTVEDSMMRLWDIDLNYKGENDYSSFFSTEGNFHPYPAKAVPQMIQTLLELLRENYGIETVLDPFVGSGTVALESKYAGLKFYGSDLNPLSILLSKTKVLTVNSTDYTIREINKFLEFDLADINDAVVELTYFNNIDYWFLEKHIYELSFIKKKVDELLRTRTYKYKEQFALILLTAFSSTIRQTSLTRNNEFKLYRMSPNKIKAHEKLNSIKVFKENVEVILDLLKKIKIEGSRDIIPEIYLNNAKELDYLDNEQVDLIMTSPPYGDSKSTVAYGQFSRLSIQWLSDLMKKYLNIRFVEENCDEHLLGGKKSQASVDRKEILERSKTLQQLYERMESKVREEEIKYNKALEKLIEIENSIINKDFKELQEHFNENKLLFELMKERIRLIFFRQLKNIGEINDKEAKSLSTNIANQIIRRMYKGSEQQIFDSIKIIGDNIPKVRSSLKRKRVSLRKRQDEVKHFFDDLFEVVLRTDQVLKNNGIQAWIVGHRTVMGDININFEKILSDWFESLGYKNITSLSREYSFKRLPLSINSTILRNEQIQTMLQEYILVVQKNPD